MPDYSDDDIKNAAELREWLTKQILEKQVEIEKLKITLNLIDSVLKQGSFQTASNLNFSKPTDKKDFKSPEKSIEKRANNDVSKPNNTDNREDESHAGEHEIKPIKRPKDNSTIATVHIYHDYIDIIPEDNIEINVDTPPFKSFFLNRILQGMKNKDLEKIKQGLFSESEIMNFEITTDTENRGLLKKIRIDRYKEKERINEIYNTAAWVLTRMLEKSEK